MSQKNEEEGREPSSSADAIRLFTASIKYFQIMILGFTVYVGTSFVIFVLLISERFETKTVYCQ